MSAPLVIDRNPTQRVKKSFYSGEESLNWDKPQFVVHKTLSSVIKKDEKATWIREKFLLNILNRVFILDRNLVHIKDVIIESQNILNKKDDWDDEGACATDENTYLKSIELLINYAKDVLNTYSFTIAVPEINLTKNGSIDLEWRSENYILLFNIQKSENLLVHYYGEDFKTKTVIKGFIDSFTINKDLAFWMQKLT